MIPDLVLLCPNLCGRICFSMYESEPALQSQKARSAKVSPINKRFTPSSDFLLVAMTVDAMRQVVANRSNYADLAELAQADKIRSFHAGRTRRK